MNRLPGGAALVTTCSFVTMWVSFMKKPRPRRVTGFGGRQHHDQCLLGNRGLRRNRPSQQEKEDGSSKCHREST